MTPEFAESLDPIFTAALSLEDRIESNVRVVTSDERAAIIRRIEEAEARLGQTEDWKLAKFAVCSWIDARLIGSNWTESAWWKEYCLEHTFFGTRDAHIEFFVNAAAAARLPSKNALEVYYIAVVLGFAGFYADYRSQDTAARLRLPDTLEGWCRETARSLHLKQGRPHVPGEVQLQGSFQPLEGKRTFINYAMASALLVAAAVVCYVLLYHKFD